MVYVNEVLPETYSQGSLFGLGFDTRIVALENMHERRTQRSSGRRKYEVSLRIHNTEDLRRFYDFYHSVAKGALNSFKFKDWIDYATTDTGMTHNGETVTWTDQSLQLVGGRTYRTIRTYNFNATTYTRHVRKLKAGTIIAGFGGSQKLPSEYTVDFEEGLVTFGGTDPIASPGWGGEYYAQVRFEETVDELFQLAALGPNTAELPTVTLIEDLTDHGWSLDRPAGGAYAQTLPPNTKVPLNQYLGMVWHMTPQDDDSGVVLPDLLEAKPGGPHFLIFNGSNANNLYVYDDLSGTTTVATIPPLSAVDLWVTADANGDFEWVFT